MVTTAAPVTIPEIALQGVTKRYRNAAVALEDISFTIQRGEFVTFLGPSGCGKSTLLKLVSGLSPVSEGAENPMAVFLSRKRAPRFDVMMMMVFLKSTVLPRPSVNWPSSNTCSRML